MPSFKYSAVGSDGRTVRGNLDATSQTECLEELRRRSLMPLKVELKSAAGGKSAAKSSSSAPAQAKTPKAKGAKAKGKGAKAKRKGSILTMDLTIGGMKPGVKKWDEVVIFTRQLATMISAGIPILESLEILQEQAQSPQFSMLLDRVIEDVRGGQDMSTAFGKYPKTFSEVYVAMIRAGEASGQIDDILARLADYLEASQKLKQEIKSAMTYPVVSLVMIMGITAFLMIGIVPKFKDVFASMDVPLPALTKGVLAISDYAVQHYGIVFLVCASLFGLLMIYKKTDKGGWQWDWLMLHIPVFGSLFQKVGLSRFAKTFSTMIRSGVPILGALEIVADTSGNRIISDAVLSARESVRQGESLAEPLSLSPVFPPMVTRMIGIGEKTGSLEQLLEKISEFYDDQVSATVKQLTSLIEPIMIAVMGVMVGTICLSVFLPIFELQKQLGSR